MSFRWYAGNIPRNRFVSVLTLDAPTFIIYFGASKVVIFLSTSCKRLLSPSCTLNGQLLGRIHEGSECASAQPVLPRLAWRSTAAGDGGFCHGVCGAFSSSRRSRPGRQAKNGDGSTSRRLRPTQILLLFQSLDGGNQGFVATGDDTLQLGIALLDHSLQFSRLFLEVFSGLVVQ
jgi:hypothetical protein